MIHQIFAISCAFQRRRRRGNRVAPRQPVIRSSSEVEGYSSGMGLKSQHGARLSAPGPKTRADKIAQLRHAVESGAYYISAEQIAEKMVQEALADMFT
jgi:anti-sigma28 factor (negative regulator of flagellin synthesis)